MSSRSFYTQPQVGGTKRLSNEHLQQSQQRAIFAIPVAESCVDQASETFKKWRDLGYLTCALIEHKREPSNCLPMHMREYVNWGWAVNRLCEAAFNILCVDWVVTGGHDNYPDPRFTADQIAAMCNEHFSGTYGVMQPAGDKYGEGIIKRTSCVSPWIGAEYARRHPLHEGYTHFYADTELKEVAEMHGVPVVERRHQSVSRPLDQERRKSAGAPETGRQSQQQRQGTLRGAKESRVSTVSKYSQYNEEEVLLDFFGDKTDGFFVDVGAADGVRFSNTRMLAERGWSGICIEPEASQYDQLRELYRGSNVTCFPVAVGTLVGFRKLHAGKADFKQISTLCSRWREKKIKQHGHCVYEESPQIIYAQVLATLLRDAPAPDTIDFLSIDAEGMDFDVLRSMDWKKYDVRLICTEDNDSIIRTFLDNVGFKEHTRTAGNTFWVKK
jgi:FkbM family methyltransferase